MVLLLGYSDTGEVGILRRHIFVYDHFLILVSFNLSGNLFTYV